jgi:hypothetical protein
MALKAILDNLDGLPADVAKEYTKGDDGKFTLVVEAVGGLALENVDGLKTALSKERETARKAGDALKPFDGLDPVKARDALTKVGEMANWTPEQKVKEQIESIKSQLLEAHGKEKATLEKRLAGYQKQLNNALITQAATAAIAEHKGVVELLLPHVERSTRIRETENGQLVVEVIDKDGNPRVDNKGNAMSITQLVESMKASDTFARAFEGSGATGSGATGGKAGGSGRPHTISRADARDHSKYVAAQEAAQKAGQPLQVVD